MWVGSGILVFDFDGVLVDSNQLKRRIFLELYANHIDHWSECMERAFAHLPYGTRYELFDYAFRDLGMKGLELEKKINESVSFFEEWLKKELNIAKPLVQETLGILSKQYSCFVNSATPISSLRASLRRLNLDMYFAEIYGAEASKSDNLRTIHRTTVCPFSKMILIGDGLNDQAAAQQVGCYFIGVPNEINGWESGQNFPILCSFGILPRLVSDYFSLL